MIDDAPAKEWSTLHSFSSDNSVSFIHIERILREASKEKYAANCLSQSRNISGTFFNQGQKATSSH